MGCHESSKEGTRVVRLADRATQRIICRGKPFLEARGMDRDTTFAMAASILDKRLLGIGPKANVAGGTGGHLLYSVDCLDRRGAGQFNSS